MERLEVTLRDAGVSERDIGSVTALPEYVGGEKWTTDMLRRPSNISLVRALTGLTFYMLRLSVAGNFTEQRKWAAQRDRVEVEILRRMGGS